MIIYIYMIIYICMCIYIYTLLHINIHIRERAGGSQYKNEQCISPQSHTVTHRWVSQKRRGGSHHRAQGFTTCLSSMISFVKVSVPLVPCCFGSPLKKQCSPIPSRHIALWRLLRMAHRFATRSLHRKE